MNQLGRTIPLVGRTAELARLRQSLDAATRGAGVTWIVSGEGGVGKTRLGRVLAEDAERRGWLVASGRAFPVESGVPYALFADALLPMVRQMDGETLAVLTRGVGELALLFPWLTREAARPPDHDAADFRNRLHWHFTQFLRGLVAKQPLLVVLEDLQWADTSSLELLHFVARQMADAKLVLLCTVNPEHPASASLQQVQQSLVSLGVARAWQLQPLSEEDVADLLQRVFGGERALRRDFTRLLYTWTRGNPFFVEETLKALVASGDLRQHEGRWTGWEVDALRLPPSVREAVLSRLGGLSASAQEVADTAAVLGARFRFETVAAAVSVPADALVAALEELRRARVLEETAAEEEVVYDFVHPLIRQTLYERLGRMRVRLLHARVAESLERRYGRAALEHADELAYHFVQAHALDTERKAVLYLRRAGEMALAKYANREAADYLSAALERMETEDGTDPETVIDVVERLARARQRLGEYRGATELWLRVQEWALAHGAHRRAAAMARRMGLACYWSGRLGEALSHFDAGLGWAAAADDTALRVRLFTARAACLQELGRPDEALRAADQAMDAAGPDAPPALRVRVHRTFVQLHLWSGQAALAREHGNAALALIGRAGDGMLAFAVHWAMGVLEAFAGNSGAVDHHLTESRRLAEMLRSPVLRVWTAELALEYASARGDWEAGLTMGEDAIRLARALQQWSLLPRLLVWTALIYLGRSEIGRGEAYIEEAWRLSGADQPTHGGVRIHAVIPAHIGRASLCLARGDYHGAIRVGEAALALCDRTGYALWGVHRLLPLIAESYLWLRDLEGARRTGQRLRRDAERLGYPLGLAWADACDALVAWLDGDSSTGAILLRQAAERLEAVPFMPDATRLRRQLAGRLAELGERDAAVRELRTVHDRLRYLGAEQELRKARLQFREMGLRPPPRGNARTQSVLTEREQAIASLVAARRSSKAIARELGISVRTVDAHLTNVYRKLSINTRGELADLVRDGALPEDE